MGDVEYGRYAARCYVRSVLVPWHPFKRACPEPSKEGNEGI